jgi:hypothetical protein
MPDQITKVIPEDPQFVPTKKAQKAAVEVLRDLAPQASGITSGVDDEVAFH